MDIRDEMALSNRKSKVDSSSTHGDDADDGFINCLMQVIKRKLAEISCCGLRKSIEGEVKDLLKMFDLAYKFETENDEKTRISIIVNAIKNMTERDPAMMKTVVENQKGDAAKNVVENQEGDTVQSI
ncbi:hypothetical protein Tco_0008187 [Tanacetum coccineum]